MKELFIKKLFRVVGVWIAILLLLYIFLEATFFFYFTRIFPLSSHDKPGMGAGIFIQYTKKHIYPHNYIAIFGDSYAYGQGDWMLEGEHSIRPFYSAAHLLHKQLDQDVISFGFPASDSIRANNILPLAAIEAAEKTRLRAVEDPDLIIVYFYEGNDLNDNVEVADKLINPLLKDNKSIYDMVNFQQVIIPSLVKSNDISRKVENISWMDGLFFFHFTKNIFLESYQNYRSGTFRAPWRPPRRGMTTRVKVNGAEEYLQDYIQSPALSLSAEQIRLGLYIFDQSLAALEKRFPKARLGIAYIPAVITPYDVTSPEIHDYYKDPRRSPERIQDSANIRKNSDAICQQVREIALRREAGFVDPRGRLRSVAKTRYIHGPIDWNHFNRRGYETLSEELVLLVQQLSNTVRPDTPECRWEI